MEEEEEHYEGGSLYFMEIDPIQHEERTMPVQTIEDQNHTVDFFKLKLDHLIKSDARIQKKLKQLHSLQRQLSFLINKSIDGKYGIPNDNLNTPKAIIPPLPPIEKGSLSDLLRIIHVSSPVEIHKYVVKSGIVEQLIFGDTSIFNSQLLESIVHTPPDVQVSFIVSVLDQIKTCSQLYYRLLSMLSQFSLNESLRNQLINTNANPQLFYQFYENVLKQFAEISKSDECKIVYTMDENQKLIFPTQDFSYIISVDDSLSGVLIQTNKPSRIEFPYQESSFEATSEKALFSSNDPILSVPFNDYQNTVSGLFILFRHSTKFSVTDEKLSSKITQYLTPILLLFRSVFIQTTPGQYAQLFQCIASLRSNEKSLFDSIKEQFSILTNATFCKLYAGGLNSIDYPELNELPQEPSLVRKSFEAEAITTIKNPRNRDDFNKEVDDEVTLSKITSLLIVPVKNSPVIVVLYNPKKASEFTSLQMSLASNLALSLRPLLAEHEMKSQIARGKDAQEKRARSMSSLSESLDSLVSQLGSQSFLQDAESFLPQGVRAALLLFASDKHAIHLPSKKIIEVPAKLLTIHEPTVLSKVTTESNSKTTNSNTDNTTNSSTTNTTNSNIDNTTNTGTINTTNSNTGNSGGGVYCYAELTSSKEFDLIADGDKEVKCFFVVPSSTSLCIFTSKDATIFDNDTNRFYQKYGANLLLLSESHFFRYKLNEIRNRHHLVKSASQLSTAAFSELIGFSINCQYFKPPISEEPRLNKPLSIMVDTPKGIEAALTSDVPIRSEQPKKAFITYAQLMSSVLTVRKSTLKEPEMKFISFFIENNVLDVFGCTKSKFTEWITHVFSFYDDNNIDALKKFECSVFVRKLIFAKKWED